LANDILKKSSIRAYGFKKKIMKKLILLFYCSLFTIHFSLAQQYGWVDLSANLPDSNTVNKNPSDIFLMGEEGWIAGEFNTAKVYYTPDGGQTFTSQSLPANSGNVALSICMRTPQEGYLVTNTGRVLRTTDGGNQWITIANGLGLLYSVSFPPLPDTSGYICGGFGGKICRVTGNTVTIELTMASTLTSIIFPVNSAEGWVCGETIIRHRDSNGWHADQYYDNGYCYNAIHFVDNLNGWAVAVEGKIIHTTDGHNWIPQTNTDNNQLNDVFFLNTQEGWAVGDHVILHTVNGGATWIEEGENLTDSISFSSVFALNSYEVYVTGQKYLGNNQYHAILLKYTQITGIGDNYEHIPTLVFQTRPNPFCHSTVISWQLKEDSHVVLKVFDHLGKEVRTLADIDMAQGEHHVIFDASGIPAGVYFTQLNANGFVETRKLVVSR
jgi:photosystem II stability/assembly factor-like uncharacterized protein